VNPSCDPDHALQAVHQRLLDLDPDGRRVAAVLRGAFDQLYDGQRTGRYSWGQLHKTEKTHFGTLIEINLHREFGFEDGAVLDYRIADAEVDCKYSQTLHAWMIPPEAHGYLCLLGWADDQSSRWSLGILRIEPALLNSGGNRDQKSTLNRHGRDAIAWIWQREELPPNVLLQLDEDVVRFLMNRKSGQQRVNELFRQTLGMRVGRAVVATVAQQDDFMKRVRENGGARSALREEGIVILGQYQSHSQIAEALLGITPLHGEFIPVRLAPAASSEPGTVEIEHHHWRLASPSDPVVPAPRLPKI